MKRSHILLLFSLVLASPFAISNSEINIYLDDQGNAEFFGKNTESLSIDDNISRTSNLISWKTENLTSKEGNLWFFNYSLKNSSLNLILPKDSSIKELESGEVYIQNNKLSIYNKESISVYYTVKDSSNFMAYFFIILLISLIILAIIIYIIFSKIKKSNNRIEIIKQALNDREILILDKLSEIKEIKQSKLSKITNIPKASLSRHLLSLEKKRLVLRKGEGKNKIISLK